MGVSYHKCSNKKCGVTYPDVIDDCHICDCGTCWCSDECAAAGKCEFGRDEYGYIELKSCKYCRKEAFDDADILVFLLKKLKTTKPKIIKEMKVLLKK
jgi:hypothetical protein